jgi:Ion channel
VKLVIRRSWVIPALAGSVALLVIAGGATAAVETDTVSTLGRGLWWSLALMTTVGFIGDPPQTTAGAALSAILMVSGFFLLALVSAALASLFVREDERGVEQREHAENQALLDEILQLRAQVQAIQQHLQAEQGAAHGARTDDRQ